jgi:hypothetical protein
MKFEEKGIKTYFKSASTTPPTLTQSQTQAIQQNKRFTDTFRQKTLLYPRVSLGISTV